ncbi:hypothetical protein PCASD_16272, partial [Puccinia coronata f. sp. avenae]
AIAEVSSSIPTLRMILPIYVGHLAENVSLQVFMFKPVHVNVDILFLQIVCLILGHLFASIPGPLWWNPGPFDTKEAAFSVIMAASASAGVLGVEVIAAQDVMFEKQMPAIVSIMTLLSSQLIGYGIAGLLRPILVYPVQIIYPGVLPVVALFQSMSNEIIPTYLAPALSAISIWCLTLPKVPAITNLFGGSLPAEGMGLMAFSADWTLVGSHSPLFVPLLAQITDWLAYFGCIIIYSGAYTANWFNGGHLPFISYNIFDKDGHRYNLTAAVLKDGTGDAEVIERLGPPSFSTSFAVVLYCLFIGFFVPIPFIIHNRFRPHSVLAKFNVSLFIASLSHGMFGANSGRFTAVFVGFVSQFCVRKYNFKWYKTYNYILCAALDGGTQITVVALAFLLQGGAGFQVKIPTYFLNPQGPRDYCKLFNKNTSH